MNERCTYRGINALEDLICTLPIDHIGAHFLVREVSVAEHKTRQFETGATRDTDEGKLDYEAFLSPLVLERYAQFMHKNRFQKDGSFRDGDNWKKGIPKDAYMKSMFRHFMDVWLHHDGYSELTKEDLQTELCALFFNVAGYLHEELKTCRSAKE